jgi:hypothetical protein
MPVDGDVVVSNGAIREYAVGVLSKAPHLTYTTHDRGIVSARKMACQLGVDAWLTEDRTHFLLIARNRRAESCAVADERHG